MKVEKVDKHVNFITANGTKADNNFGKPTNCCYVDESLPDSDLAGLYRQWNYERKRIRSDE